MTGATSRQRLARAVAGTGWLVVKVSLLALIVVIALGPVVWQAITSVKPDGDLMRLPPLLPDDPTVVHYRTVLTESSLGRGLLNSAVVAVSVTALAIGLGGLCAFALARLPIGGKGLILSLVLFASMFPPIAVISPLYLLVRVLGLRDTLAGLILVHTTFALPLVIWVLANSFRQIPVELYWAAQVDGATALRTFRSVILPVALPSLTVAALLVFIYSWNEFMFALTLTASETSRTAPVAVALFPGLHEVPWGDMAAATLIVIAPVVLVALLFQKQIVAGLTTGSVKG
ncbi:MAG: carbohydrate ABC transporter permease [Nitrospiraceae bacterium]